MKYDLDLIHHACSTPHLPRGGGKTVAICFQVLGYLQLGTKNYDSEFTQIAIGCLDQNHMKNFMDTCKQVLESHGMAVVNERRQGYSFIWTVKDYGRFDMMCHQISSTPPDQTITFFPSTRKEDWEIGRPPYLFMEDVRGY